MGEVTPWLPRLRPVTTPKILQNRARSAVHVRVHKEFLRVVGTRVTEVGVRIRGFQLYGRRLVELLLYSPEPIYVHCESRR